MNDDASSGPGSRILSFRNALRGLGALMATQPNARIHAAATIAACAVAYLVEVSRLEWCLIAVAVVTVWTAEALNTALELLCDAAVPDVHPLVGRAKDVAAGGVLISAVGAAVIGLLVLGPRIVAIVR